LSFLILQEESGRGGNRILRFDVAEIRVATHCNASLRVNIGPFRAIVGLMTNNIHNSPIFRFDQAEITYLPLAAARLWWVSRVATIHFIKKLALASDECQLLLSIRVVYLALHTRLNCYRNSILTVRPLAKIFRGKIS
jgi:hypothetical protein